jgi:hypothetical protein
MASKQKAKMREQFRQAVFKRDGYKCVFCSCTHNLDAHHITDRNLMPNGGYVKENGITLCPTHHMDAEMFHSIGESPPGFQPDDLYILINSSFKKAYHASSNL